MENAPKPDSEHEEALRRAKRTFEEAQREHEMRKGDPEKLKKAQERMRKLYPTGHEVPEKVGQPFQQVRGKDDIRDAA